MKYLAAALVAATACGSSTPHSPREVDLAIVPFSDIPSYLQYRDGDGPWQRPQSSGYGTYRLVVTDSYEVLAVFGDAEIEELRATVDDPLPVITAQPPAPSMAARTIDVSGQVVAATSILVETPPGVVPQYAYVDSGTFDVKAYDTSSYLYAFGSTNGLATIVRRSFSAGQVTDIGQIDVATEGRLLPTHPLVISNASGTPYVDIDGPGGLTLRDHSAITGTEVDMPLLPESMRQDGDRYSITVATGEITTWQTYRSTDAASLTEIELLSPTSVDLVQYPTSATWAIDDRDAELDATGGVIQHRVHATAGWLAATGASSLTAHEDLPGFDPRWQVAAMGHVAITLTLSSTTPTSVNSVTMSN